jgi:hypothetical protein
LGILLSSTKRFQNFWIRSNDQWPKKLDSNKIIQRLGKSRKTSEKPTSGSILISWEIR